MRMEVLAKEHPKSGFTSLTLWQLIERSSKQKEPFLANGVCTIVHPALPENAKHESFHVAETHAQTYETQLHPKIHV